MTSKLQGIVERTRRYRCMSMLVIVTLLAAMTPGWRGVLAQTVERDRHAEVIAQGVGTLPSGQVVWRVTDGTAPATADSTKVTYPLGFVFVPKGKVQVDYSGTGNRVVLEDGEATFQQDGTEQRRKGAETTAVPYLAVELVSADQVSDLPVGNQLVSQSEPFAAPEGDRDLNLVRDVLEANEEGLLPGSDTPTYVYVTDGSVGVEIADGTRTELATGEGALFTGKLRIDGSAGEGGTYLAAVIGDQVAKGEGNGNGTGGGAGNGRGGGSGNGNGNGGGHANAGTEAKPTAAASAATLATSRLEVTVHQCPSDANPPGGDFTHCQDVEDPTGVVSDVTLGSLFPLSSAPIRPELTHTYVWDAIPVSSYTIAPGLAGSVWTLVSTEKTGDPSSMTSQTHTDIFDVKSGQTTYVEAFVYGSDSATPVSATMASGQLRVTVFSCATDPAVGDLSGCMPVDAGSDATVQNVAGTNAFLLQSAPMRDGSTYVWDAIPEDDYELHAFVDPSSSDVVYVNVSYGGTVPMTSGDFGVVSGGSTDVEVYLYTPLVEPTAEASPSI